MKPHPIAQWFAFAIAGVVLPAQTVSISAAALTPIPCVVTVGTQTISQSLPVGPLASFGGFGASIPGAPAVGQAQFGWSGTATPTYAEFLLSLATNLDGSGVARVGPGEVLVTFTGSSAAAMAIRYHGEVAILGSGGTTAWCAVDVGNNGTIDWQPGQGQLFGTVADLVAQPLQLRVLFDDIRAVAGSGQVRITLRVTPDNGIHVFRLPTNCGIYNSLTVEPLFDTSIADLQFRSMYTTWHVLGLQQQPQLLPAALTLTAQPCFVMPTPDLVLRTGQFYLPIPAAVRPVVLYAQLVDLAPYVRVSDTFQIIAL